MIVSWITAGLIVVCAAVVGRAATRIAGKTLWSGLEPALGFAVIVVFEGVLTRISADRPVLLLGMVTLLMLSAAVIRPPQRSDLPAISSGLAIVLGVVFVALNVPFIAAGHWGVPGLSDSGIFLTQILSEGSGRITFVGAEAFGGLLGASGYTGLLMATAVVTAWTAWEAADRLAGWKRPLAAVLVTLPYLIASAYAAAAFTQLATALFLLSFLVAIDRAIASRRQDLPRSGEVLIPTLLTAGTLGTLACFSGLETIAAGGLAGSVSPFEGLGIWLSPDYRLHLGDPTPLPGLLATIGGLSLLLSLWWWSREPRSVWPLAVPILALAWLVAKLIGGDLPGQILAVASPVVATTILVALLTGPRGGWKPQQGMEFGGWTSLTALFVIGSIASSAVVLRDTPVVPVTDATVSAASGHDADRGEPSVITTPGNPAASDIPHHQSNDRDDVDLPDQGLGGGE